MLEITRLDVSLNGSPVGSIEDTRRGLSFTYAPEALEAHPGNRPLLSCSLLLDDRAQPAAPFFEGLLPEGQHRAAIAARADLVASDTFGLLARYGRDIAGAVTVVAPEPPTDRAPGALPLTADELDDEVAGLPDHPLGIHEDSELSLAGLQDKLLLVRLDDGRWARPIAGYPSTHILKLDSRQFPGVVAAEGECMALARAVGLTSVDTILASYAGIDCLIVERFDRTVGPDGTPERVHQEDACQALGVLPARKYEVRLGGGGPELTQIAGLLDLYAADPVAQMDRLTEVVAFTALIANADAHGKNLAFLHTEPGVIELAPLYDQVPTRLWPKLEPGAAMTIGGGLNLDTVTRARIGSEAKLWRHSPARAIVAATTLAEQLLVATTDGTIDPGGDVARFVRERTRRFLAA